jgi:hypothetical protein
MKNNMFIDPTTIVGKKFVMNDPAIEYVCVGYGQNDTFLIFGAANDVTNNRFTLKSFKFSEVKFIGQI